MDILLNSQDDSRSPAQVRIRCDLPQFAAARPTKSRLQNVRLSLLWSGSCLWIVRHSIELIMLHLRLIYVFIHMSPSFS